MSFSQGLSGLNAASEALDVVGNNIANSQTVGFKSGSIAFADVFAGSQIGMGVQVAGVNQSFADGVLGAGSGEFDMAIQGNGFFRLTDDAGRIYYSRNGQFQQDENGYIINNQNMYVTGYQATGTPPSIQQGAAVGPIQIPTGQMPAKASDSGEMKGNLDSEEEVVTKTPFDATNSDTYTSMSQVTAYDSQGNEHTVNVYYVKESANEWSVYSNDVTAPAPDYTHTTLQFDANGNQTSSSLPTLSINSSAYNGAAPLSFNMDLSGITQQHATTAVDCPTTNGYAPGKFNGCTIGESGEIIANYSNGETQLLGQVVLSSFANPGGLESKGNNCWQETPSSGQPATGVSGSGSLGSLYGGKLEASNVDLSQQMVDMIVYQRNYQSNSQTIKTQSEIMQTLVNLG